MQPKFLPIVPAGHAAMSGPLRYCVILLVALTGMMTLPCRGALAQSNEELAKALSNPIASLISVPFQFNYDTDFGTLDGKRFLLNIQPVVPVSLNDDWNLISRTILPVISQEDVVPREGSQIGIGDIVQSVFFSPKESGPGGVIWGVGPVALLPTATKTDLNFGTAEATLGGEKWGLGPTAVGLRQTGPWTYGLLANHIWSVAGNDSRSDISATFLQPFLSYTTKSATTFALNTESTYDWKGGEASVPVNFMVNQLLTIGEQRLQLGAGIRYWADAPDNGPEGIGYRLNLIFLFPAAT